MTKGFVLSTLKWGAAIELSLVLLVLLISYYAKVYFYRKVRKENKIKNKFSRIIKNASMNNPKQIKRRAGFFKSYIHILLDLLPSFEKNSDLIYWPQVKNSLIENVLKPESKRLASHKSFSSRYMAILCLKHFSEKWEHPILINLIQDNTLLISLNAALLALKQPTEKIVNIIIDHFSKGRRLQQTLFSDEFAQCDPSISKDIIKRLSTETKPYIKAFCYRLLAKLITTDEVYQPAVDDLNSDVLDLRITALQYCAEKNLIPIETLRNFLNDPSWQVRVTAIKLLTKKGDKDAIPLLCDLLKDKEWWVRMNAAQSLLTFGKEGMAILKSQDPTIDRYAYEVATYVLRIAENSN